MNSLEYQQYIFQQLIDRFKNSSWSNFVFAALVLAVSLMTFSFTPIHSVAYIAIAILTALRLKFYNSVVNRKTVPSDPAQATELLRKDNNIFTLLVGSMGLCWGLIVGLPSVIGPHSVFWNQFVYFLATSLHCSALFNAGISRRNFFAFSIPILVALSLSSIITQENFTSQMIFFVAGLLFFAYLMTFQRMSETVWFAIFSKQHDMNQILEGFPGAVSLVENNRYLYMNSKLVSLLGSSVSLKKHEFVGTHKINQHLVDRITAFEASTRDSEEFETELDTNQGKKIFWILLKRLQDKKTMILSIDIDEKRNNERKIEEQNIKLIESSKMASLGEMSSGIAHEINNPLTIIQGSTRKIGRIAENLEASVRQDIDKSTSKIDIMTLRITKIISGLRSFAREGSHDPFEYVPAKRIIVETLFICESRFKNSNIEIRKNYDLVDANILCRSVQISQVLLNLLNNSFDAIVEKRSELPTTSNSEQIDFIEIETQILNDQFYIAVKDTGKGIPKNVQEKIMQPFFTTKGVGKGTGLGLSISKSIMEDHNGELVFNFMAPQTQALLVFKHFNIPV